MFSNKISGESLRGVDVTRGDMEREPGVVIVGEIGSSGGVGGRFWRGDCGG